MLHMSSIVGCEAGKLQPNVMNCLAHDAYVYRQAFCQKTPYVACIAGTDLQVPSCCSYVLAHSTMYRSLSFIYSTHCRWGRALGA